MLVHPTEGRGKLLGDEMIEDIVNHAAQGGNGFHWDHAQDTIWFHAATAHSWWLEHRRRRGRGGLERESLLNQFPEMGYITGPIERDNRWVYSIDLSQAYKFGLDIPKEISTREIVFRI